MDNYTIFTKTAKGLGEALGKTKNLSREQRKILKEIDGKASFEALAEQVDMDVARLEAVISRLLTEDYIREFGSCAPRSAHPNGDTVFDLAGPATIEAANSQLTIGDFFRAMEQPQTATRNTSTSVGIKRLLQADAGSSGKSAALDAAQKEQTRRAIEDEARRMTERAQVIAEAARRAAELQSRAAVEQARRRAAEEQARQEAEEIARQARIKAEHEARLLAEEAARRQEELARRQVEEDARKRAEEEARLLAEARARQEAEDARLAAEARKQAQEQARIKAREAARRAAEELAQREAEARAKAEAEQQARIKAEEEARLAAEEQARCQAEEAARLAAAEQAKRDAEAAARLRAEEAARQEAEEQSRRQAQEQAKEEARQRARQEAEEAARLKAEHKAQQKAEAKARKEAQAQAKREAREQARREAEAKSREEAERKSRQAAEAKARKEAEEQEKRHAREAARHAAEEAARQRAEEAALRQAQKNAEQAARQAEKQAAAAAAEAEANAASADDTAQMPHGGSPASAGIPAEAAAASGRGLRLALPFSLGKLARLGAIALTGLAIAALAMLHVMPFDGRRTQLEQDGSAQLGEPVRIGSLGFSLLPQPHWRLQEVTIGARKQIAIPQVNAGAMPGSLFSAATPFSSIELISPVIDEEGLGWILFGKLGRSPWPAAALTASQARLRTAQVQLPAVDVVAEFDGAGGWRKLVLNATTQKIYLDLQRSGDTVRFELTANDIVLPFGGSLAFDTFNAAGMIARDGLDADRFTGLVGEGKVSGTGKLRWQNDWSLKGEAQARAIAPARLAPGLFQGGTLDGNFKYAMQDREAAKLMTSLQARGGFHINGGTLLGVDMASQVMGQSGNGKTSFNEINGDFALDGGKVRLMRMHLAAGLLSAAGDAAVDAAGRLNGQLAIDLQTSSRQAHGRLNLAGTPAAPQFSR